MASSFDEIGGENETIAAGEFMSMQGPRSGQLDQALVVSACKAADMNFKDCPTSHPAPRCPGLSNVQAKNGAAMNTSTNTNTDTHINANGNTNGEVHIQIQDGEFERKELTIMNSNGDSDSSTNGEVLIQIQDGESLRRELTNINSNSNRNSNGEVLIRIQDVKFVRKEPTNTNGETHEVLIRIQGGELVRKELLFDRHKVIKIFIVIVAQAALTLSTIGSITTGASSFLTPFAINLLEFAKVCNVISFVCFLYAILVCHRDDRGGAARILTGVGVFATTYGILAVMCMELVKRQVPQILITVVVFIACIPALIAAFRS